MIGPRAVFAVCAAALAGCAGSEPQPRIDAVDPAQGYTDRDLRLTLTGAGFVPSFRLDPVSGERVATMEGFSGQVSDLSKSAPLTDFGWVSPTQISADLDIQDPDDLAVGPCDVEIMDPRGHKAILSRGFLALGRYMFVPDLTVTSPAAGDLYAPGSLIHGQVTATDGPPGHLVALKWTYTEPTSDDGSQRDPVMGNCPSGLRSDRIDCAFDVTISPGLDPGMTVNLNIVALDDAMPPNQSSPIRVHINLSQRPTVSSVTPQSGGVAGGTNVVLRGSGFVPGSHTYFGNSLLVPDGGIVVDNQTITGYTPGHYTAAAVPVTVQSRLGYATWAYKFQYQLPPQIQSIVPSFGTQGENTFVTVSGTNFTQATVIYLGQTLAGAVVLASPSWRSTGEIDGVVPPGNGQAWVWAVDANNGWTRLPDQFSWIAP
jgi:hypothetical protein